MDVILLENVKSLGQIGKVVKVKRGYARNYLIKFGKALIATKGNIDLVNKKKDKLNKKNIEIKKSAKKLYDVINNKKYTFYRRAIENNELYGSVKPTEVGKQIENIEKVEIKPSSIDLSEEIKKIGSFSAKVNLHPEVQAKILIEVVKEEETK